MREVSKLEKQIIVNIVEATNGKYKKWTIDSIPDGDIVKNNQVNIAILNMKNIGLVTIHKDMFNTLVELTHRGKHQYRKIVRESQKSWSYGSIGAQ